MRPRRREASSTPSSPASSPRSPGSPVRSRSSSRVSVPSGPRMRRPHRGSSPCAWPRASPASCCRSSMRIPISFAWSTPGAALLIAAGAVDGGVRGRRRRVPRLRSAHRAVRAVAGTRARDHQHPEAHRQRDARRHPVPHLPRARSRRPSPRPGHRDPDRARLAAAGPARAALGRACGHARRRRSASAITAGPGVFAERLGRPAPRVRAAGLRPARHRQPRPAAVHRDDGRAERAGLRRHVDVRLHAGSASGAGRAAASASIGAALFGGHAINLAAITAALMASPESHPDKSEALDRHLHLRRRLPRARPVRRARDGRRRGRSADHHHRRRRPRASRRLRHGHRRRARGAAAPHHRHRDLPRHGIRHLDHRHRLRVLGPHRRRGADGVAVAVEAGQPGYGRGSARQQTQKPACLRRPASTRRPIDEPDRP